MELQSSSCHMGGSWERMIRSIKRILDILLKFQVVTDDVLHTLLLEVESILNSRPLCPITLDPYGNEPLTPNHLLLLRRSYNDPPGVSNPETVMVVEDGVKSNTWLIPS